MSTSQDELNAILCEAVPRQGAWTDEEYLWLTDRSRRLIEFTDGYVQELPMHPVTHRHRDVDDESTGFNERLVLCHHERPCCGAGAESAQTALHGLPVALQPRGPQALYLGQIVPPPEP